MMGSLFILEVRLFMSNTDSLVEDILGRFFFQENTQSVVLSQLNDVIELLSS